MRLIKFTPWEYIKRYQYLLPLFHLLPQLLSSPGQMVKQQSSILAWVTATSPAALLRIIDRSAYNGLRLGKNKTQVREHKRKTRGKIVTVKKHIRSLPHYADYCDPVSVPRSVNRSAKKNKNTTKRISKKKNKRKSSLTNRRNVQK